VDEQRERNIANGFVDPREHTDKWWFRLDERDGEIVVPTEKNDQKLCRSTPSRSEGRAASGSDR
jgi:hypothetical protein